MTLMEMMHYLPHWLTWLRTRGVLALCCVKPCPLTVLKWGAVSGLLIFLLGTKISLWAESTPLAPDTSKLSGHLQYPETPANPIASAIPTDRLPVHAYRLGPQDVISLSIYGHGDLSQEAIRLRSDGYGSFPMIGEILLNQKTVLEAQALLAERYSEYLKHPLVTVGVVETRPVQIYLSGAVLKPGMIELATQTQMATDTRTQRQSTRLSNMISLAGGIQPTADLQHIVIRRGDTQTTVNLLALLQNGDAQQDVVLQNGDEVVVPELETMALDDAAYQKLLQSSLGPQHIPVRVEGFVKQPGLIQLDAQSPYLRSAIVQCQGFEESAERKTITILRLSNQTPQAGHLSKITVNPNAWDVVLRPNDIVLVQDTHLGGLSKKGKQLAQLLSPFTTLSSSFFSAAFLRGGLR